MAIAKDPWVKDKLKEIARAKDRIQLHEGDTRNLLYSLHEVYCNGQRGVAIKNLTIGEFNSIPGSSLDNAQCARVKNHKTGKVGPAPVVYALPYLHKAVKNYIKLFRVGASDESAVFINSLGNQVDPRYPHEYLKNMVIKKLGILNNEQLTKLSSKAWRKVLTYLPTYLVTLFTNFPPRPGPTGPKIILMKM